MKSKIKTNKIIYYPLLFFIIIFLVFIFLRVYFHYQAVILKKQVFEQKVKLLQSNNLSDVTLGGIWTFAPVTSQDLEYGYHDYTFKSFYTDLTDNELQRLLASLPKDKSFIDTRSGFNINSSDWLNLQQTDVQHLWIKNGFVCRISTESNGICPVGSKCKPLQKFVNCANVADYTKNTYEVNLQFITELFKNGRVTCLTNKTCTLTEQTLDSIPLPQLSRKYYNFTVLKQLSLDEYKILAQKDINESLKVFKAASWKVDTKDLISKWNKSDAAYLKLYAENENFKCTHELTISKSIGENDGKYKKMDIFECYIHPNKIGALE